jgi:hypothetical protein
MRARCIPQNRFIRIEYTIDASREATRLCRILKNGNCRAWDNSRVGRKPTWGKQSVWTEENDSVFMFSGPPS